MKLIEREKKKVQMQTLYKNLITNLKILYMRLEHGKEYPKAERYKNAYEKLELIQERRHLTEIGKEGEHKQAYITTLQMIQENYKENDKAENTINNIINEIEQICTRFNIKEKEVQDKSINNIGVER